MPRASDARGADVVSSLGLGNLRNNIQTFPANPHRAAAQPGVIPITWAKNTGRE